MFCINRRHKWLKSTLIRPCPTIHCPSPYPLFNGHERRNEQNTSGYWGCRMLRRGRHHRWWTNGTQMTEVGTTTLQSNEYMGKSHWGYWVLCSKREQLATHILNALPYCIPLWSADLFKLAISRCGWECCLERSSFIGVQSGTERLSSSSGIIRSPCLRVQRLCYCLSPSKINLLNVSNMSKKRKDGNY